MVWKEEGEEEEEKEVKEDEGGRIVWGLTADMARKPSFAIFFSSRPVRPVKFS